MKKCACIIFKAFSSFSFPLFSYLPCFISDEYMQGVFYYHSVILFLCVFCSLFYFFFYLYNYTLNYTMIVWLDKSQFILCVMWLPLTVWLCKSIFIIHRLICLCLLVFFFLLPIRFSCLCVCAKNHSIVNLITF